MTSSTTKKPETEQPEAKLFPKPPDTKGVPKGANTAAEMYRVLDSFERFNQKNNMTRQPFWNPPATEQAKKQEASLQRLLAEGKPGYTYVDYAFQAGAGANLANTGFSINMPNVAGNSWSPLRKGVPKERWQASLPEATRVMRKAAKLFGADIVGFAKLDRRWVYSHYFDEETKQDYPIRFSDEPGYEQYDKPQRLEDRSLLIPKEMQYVVVMVFEMEEEGVAGAPTLLQMATTHMTYSQISFTTVMVAEFLRGLGYNAIPSSNCTALNIPLAIDAGLGQLGRNAKLITPKYGPRCRIGKVITDLPVEVGKPRDFGVTEFCNACKKCARMCGPNAIPFEERTYEPQNECNHSGVLQWMVDHKKCRDYQARVGTNCGVCLRVCPFNKGHSKIHDVTRFFIKNVRWMDPLIAKGDDVMGFGGYKRSDKFWGLEGYARNGNGEHPGLDVEDASEGVDAG